jgi:hypothetical protein
VTLKEAILASFDRVGGIDYLERQARENPTAYMTLLAKVLPMQVTGPNDGPIMVITGVARASDVMDLEHEPAPMPSPRPLPQPAPTAIPSLAPATEAPDQDPEPDPPDMRAVAMTRTGARFREVPPVPPLHEGSAVTTETGLRVRTVRPVD